MRGEGAETQSLIFQKISLAGWLGVDLAVTGREGLGSGLCGDSRLEMTLMS